MIKQITIENNIRGYGREKYIYIVLETEKPKLIFNGNSTEGYHREEHKSCGSIRNWNA